MTRLTRGQRYRGPGGEIWWIIDPESAIRLIECVEECECCEQSKIVHSEQEVTL